jgi:large subunit ribosomal protein MRP49
MQLTINGQPVAAQSIPELIEWQPVEVACWPPVGASLALTAAGEPLEPFQHPGDPAWRWRWNPRNGVGLYPLCLTLRLPDRPEQQHNLRVRVVPRKIDQQAYLVLLGDIRRAARALAYRLGPLAESAALAELPEGANPLEASVALLDEGIARLEQVLAEIARRPREELRAAAQQRPLEQAETIDPAALAQLARLPAEPVPPAVLPELQRHLRREGGLLPRELPSTRHQPSHDTYENRLLKQVLGRLDGLLRLCARQLADEQGRLGRNRGYVEAEQAQLAATAGLLARIEACAARLQALRSLPFLADVSPLTHFHGPSPAMQRDPRYRQVYRLWQELRRRPLLDPFATQLALPIHELPRLYEIWCALQAAEALLALPGAHILSQRLLADPESEQETLTLCLPEDAPLLEIQLGAGRLALRYQPRYRPLEAAGGRQAARAEQLCSLDRHTRVPDLAVELHAGGPLGVLLFDAKYRLDAGGGLPQDALADAYAYLGSIGHADGTRAAQAAYLLYPGRGKGEHYPSGVGALPLFPGAAGRADQAHMFAAIIQQAFGLRSTPASPTADGEGAA